MTVCVVVYSCFNGWDCQHSTQDGQILLPVEIVNNRLAKEETDFNKQRNRANKDGRTDQVVNRGGIMPGLKFRGFGARSKHRYETGPSDIVIAGHSYP